MYGLSAVAAASVDSAERSQPARFGLDPVDALLGEQPRRARRAAVIDCSRLRAISGMRTLSSNWPCRPPTVIAVSLPITCALDLQHDLGDHRVDLARHDRGALLQLRQEQLADPGARARAHQREVVGDLRQRDGDDLQRARQLDQRVAVGLRLERVLRRRDLPGRWPRAASPRTRAANSGCVFRPVPVAVPPSGICATCGSALRTRSRAEADLRGVAGELLAERHGHGVHQVRAAGLDDVLERRRPSPRTPPRAARAPAAGRSSPRRARRGGRRSGRRRSTTGPC